MHRLQIFGPLALLLILTAPACGQQFDIAVGASGLSSTSGANASGNYSPQDVGGGTFIGFSGDVIPWHHLGVEGEVYWRAHSNVYNFNTPLGGQPFRPIFWNINAIYSREVARHVGFEALAGIGEESVRYYTPYGTCDYFTCTNYNSIGHVDFDFGGGVKLFVKGGFFVRPEVRVYLVHNNLEFSSGHVQRYGISLGYSAGEH